MHACLIGYRQGSASVGNVESLSIVLPHLQLAKCCVGAGGGTKQCGGGPAGSAHCPDRAQGGAPDGQVSGGCGILCGEPHAPLPGTVQRLCPFLQVPGLAAPLSYTDTMQEVCLDPFSQLLSQSLIFLDQESLEDSDSAEVVS